MYYAACDLISGELQRLFETKHIPSVISIDQALIKAANKEDFQSEVKKIGESCFGDDIDMSELNVQLPLLHDIIKKAMPEVRIVTSIHTICDAMDSNEVFKEMLPAVHNLLISNHSYNIGYS